MEICKIKIEDIIPYENNVKEHPEEQIEQLKNSILEFGNNDPIAIDENNVIIEGHGRLLALKELGYKEAECIRLTGLSEEQKNAYRIVHNQLTMNTGFDMEALKTELEGINLNMLDFGLTEDMLEALEDKAPIEDDNFDLEEALEEIEEPVTKLGDLWRLGNHYLLCGDSTKESDIKALMQGNTADMVFTDPPYGVKYEARTGIRSKEIRPEMSMILNDDLEGEELQNFINVAIYNLKLFSKENAPFYICNNWHCFEVFIKALKINKLDLTAFIVWNKDWMSVGQGDYRSNHEFIFYCKNKGRFYAPKGTENDVWTIRKLSPDKKLHTTEKPIELSGRAIQNSCKKNNIVLDLFGGSGSTLIACEKLNRNCYTMELDPKYCDVIIKRWELLTGNKAELIKD